MPIIRPSGLLGGDRIAELSDQAKLYWPWLYAASNGYGRFELDYLSILEKAFRHFSKRPSEDELAAALQEYREACLLFVYETPAGEVWGAWDSNSGQHFFNHADKASPAPPEEEFNEWKESYRAKKSGTTTRKKGQLGHSLLKGPLFALENDDFRKVAHEHTTQHNTTQHNTSSYTQDQTQQHSPEPLQLVENPVAAVSPEVELRFATARQAGKAVTRTLRRLLADERMWVGWTEFDRDYPLKVGMDEAFCAYWELAESMEITPETAPEVLAGLGRYRASDRWTQDGGRYVCSAKVFLIGDGERRRGRMWKDYPPKAEIPAKPAVREEKLKLVLGIPAACGMR